MAAALTAANRNSLVQARDIELVRHTVGRVHRQRVHPVRRHVTARMCVRPPRRIVDALPSDERKRGRVESVALTDAERAASLGVQRALAHS